MYLISLEEDLFPREINANLVRSVVFVVLVRHVGFEISSSDHLMISMLPPRTRKSRFRMSSLLRDERLSLGLVFVNHALRMKKVSFVNQANYAVCVDIPPHPIPKAMFMQ